MAIYNLNMADENLIEEITDVDTLTKRVPRLTDFFDGIQDVASWQVANGKLGQFTGKTGFSTNGNLQRIATIPFSVAQAVREIDPTYWRDPVKVGKFLKKHPEYCTVRTVR